MKQIQYPFITRKLSKDDGDGYLIEFPDLPGCIADGESIEEAVIQARDAIESYIKTCIAHGDEVPKPSTPDNFSGQWRVRVPKSLHAALAMKAKEEGISLNMLTATLLASGIHKDNSINKKKTRIKTNMIIKNKTTKQKSENKTISKVKDPVKKKTNSK